MVNRSVDSVTTQSPDHFSIVEDGLVTVKAASKFLGVGRTMLYQEMEAGRLPYCKIGRARRIPRRALLEFAAGTLTGGWAIQQHSQCRAPSLPLTE